MLGLGLSLAVSQPAGAVQVIIADTSDPQVFSSFNQLGLFLPGSSPAPSINTSGHVAFWAATQDGEKEGIYRGDGGAVVTISLSEDGFNASRGHLPTINNAGVVAFQSVGADGVDGIYKGDGGAVKEVIRGGGVYSSFGDPSINEGGRVAFFAEKLLGVDLLSKLDAHIAALVASTTGFKFDDFPGFPLFGVPGLNALDRVAFYAWQDAGDPGVFTSKGTTGAIAETVVDTSVDLTDFRNAVINASGRVAVWASTDAGERIVFAENGQVHTVIDTLITTYDGVGFATLGDPALNDSGGIAFWALLDNGLQGVFFVDPAGNLSRVIQETDSLAGSNVFELGFGSNGLSNSGKLAVWAELEDGTEVVLRLDSSCSSGVDDDADGVDDACDNCLLIPNPTQLDAGHDGYGNACDPDLNNDGVVNFADLAALKKVFFKADAFADLNGDGVVNFADLAIMKKAFFKAPGPAAGKP